MVDPRHPLFGQFFRLVAITTRRHTETHCVIWLQIDGCWTTRGLAAQLGVEVRAILRQIYRHVIPPERTHRHPDSGVYLIDDYAELLPTLQQALRSVTQLSTER